MTDRYEKRLKKLLREGDVIPFPKGGKRGLKQRDAVDNIQNTLASLQDGILAQNETEQRVREQLDDLLTNGEANRKKFYVPFIMKDYTETTNPIQALVWELYGFLSGGDHNDYSIEQWRFAYNFFVNNREVMIRALNEDIHNLEELYKETMRLKIALPRYAAAPVKQKLLDYTRLRDQLIYFGQYDGVFDHPERQWGDIQLRNRDRLLAESVETQPFDRRTTSMPWYDDMLENPTYFEEEKGIIWMLYDMSPQEYIDRCINGFRNFHEYSGNIFASKDEDRARKYATMMLDGVTFPMPVLDYTRLSFTQEGFHRAWAAKIAGLKTIPVLVVDNTAEEKKEIRKYRRRK